MKKGAKKFIYNFIKCEGITATIAGIVILIIFLRRSSVTIIDWTMFTTIVVALLLSGLSKIIQAFIMNKLEDSVKLTENYDELARKYKNGMVVYDNSRALQDNLRKCPPKYKKKICIPVICEYELEQCEIEIEDSTAQYELPDIIKEHFDELFAAHSRSKIYNQLNIRVDDWEYKNKKLIIKTSRTTYFDSLVTNRAMDFQWHNGLTIREQFEYGPFIHTLKESCLSNHIGFNGFVESSDGYIVFVKRGNRLSIGKGTYGDSVGASLKTKYALDCSGKLTETGLIEAILSEITNELKIQRKELIEEFSVGKHLIAAYRDIVEGGKPQLLFYVRSSLTKEMIEQNFFAEVKKSSKIHQRELLEDGKKLVWIPQKELDHICILPNMIIYQGKTYRMMPSAAASIVMLIEYLKNSGG